MTSKKPININAEMEKANMRMERKALGTSKSLSEDGCNGIRPAEIGRSNTSVNPTSHSADEMPKVEKKLFLVANPIDEGCDSVGNHLWSFDSINGYVELTPSDLELIKEELTGRIVFTPEQFQKEIDKIPQKEALLKKLEALK